MKPIAALFLIAAPLCFGQSSEGPKNELAFGLGGIPSLTRSDSPFLNAGPGPALQVNYGRRFVSSGSWAWYGEINFLASPLRDVTSSPPFATHDFASLYVTPGIRVKYSSGSRFSPYAVIGGGYADYEQSTTRLDGRPNNAPRQLGRAVLDFGAGLDVRVWRFVALRGEARDFYSGSPDYNVNVGGGQNNVVATGAFVIRWR